MTMLNAMLRALPQASAKQCDKQCQNETSEQSTDGRTDELTKNSKTSRDTSSSNTCAHVQDFDDYTRAADELTIVAREHIAAGRGHMTWAECVVWLRNHSTAERKPEPTRELRDPAEVINAHLEESA